MTLDVRTSIEMEQGIGWRSRLGIIRRIEVILAEIAIHGKLQEEIIKGSSTTDKLILHIPIPSWRRSQRQILRFRWLMKLYGIDIRETIADMQMRQWMHIHPSLATKDASIGSGKLISWRIIHDDFMTIRICHLLDEDIVVDAIGKQSQLRRDERRK